MASSRREELGAMSEEERQKLLDEIMARNSITANELMDIKILTVAFQNATRDSIEHPDMLIAHSILEDRAFEAVARMIWSEGEGDAKIETFMTSVVGDSEMAYSLFMTVLSMGVELGIRFVEQKRA